MFLTIGVVGWEMTDAVSGAAVLHPSSPPTISSPTKQVRNPVRVISTISPTCMSPGDKRADPTLARVSVRTPAGLPADVDDVPRNDHELFVPVDLAFAQAALI